MLKKEVLVSVITPAYNSAKFIAETIKSVQLQTVTDWEMIVIDDASTDNTVEIVKHFLEIDKRIKLFSLKTNHGPSKARQLGTKLALGRYIAFLDSDDLWYVNKLERQINFMVEHNCAFSCTAYEQIDEEGHLKNRVITPPRFASYNRVILDCPVGNSTVIYDTWKIGKCYGPDIKNREDYGLWLKILKKEKFVFGLQETLSKYRIRRKSMASNKFKLVFYHWILYRDFEHLSIIRSLFHICFWCVIKILRIK